MKIKKSDTGGFFIELNDDNYWHIYCIKQLEISKWSGITMCYPLPTISVMASKEDCFFSIQLVWLFWGVSFTISWESTRLNNII